MAGTQIDGLETVKMVSRKHGVVFFLLIKAASDWFQLITRLDFVCHRKHVDSQNSLCVPHHAFPGRWDHESAMPTAITALKLVKKLTYPR